MHKTFVIFQIIILLYFQLIMTNQILIYFKKINKFIEIYLINTYLDKWQSV